MVRSFALFASLVSMCIAVGCGEHSQIPPVRPTRPETTESGSVKKATDAGQNSTPSETAGDATQTLKPVELVEANWSELQTLVGEHKGKVIVVDVWSTACEPCMKEFPHLIALQKKYPDDVLAISYDIDYAGIKNKPPAYYRERVLQFLGSQTESQVLHRMCNTPAEDLFTELHLDSIPAIYVYGRDGALAKRFDGANSDGKGVSYERQVTPFVDTLVK